MATRTVARIVARAAGIAGVAGTAYFVAVRPWHLRWGATEEEVRRGLPGDDVVGHPQIAGTRAITIDARPEHIWPWLVQQGYGRAGWYAYPVDNAFHYSPYEIIAELQNLDVGDVVPTSPSGGFTVREIEPERHLLLEIDDPRVHITVCQVLVAGVTGPTRLLQRFRMYFRPTPGVALYALLLDLGDFFFMRREMMGIRERAERTAQIPPSSPRPAVSLRPRRSAARAAATSARRASARHPGSIPA